MTVPLPFAPVLRRVGAEAGRLGLDAYAVGGAVRDAILDRPTTDLDVVAVGPGSGIALAQATAKALGVRPPAVYAAFGTAAVTVPAAALADVMGEGEDTLPERLIIEFVGARRESYRAESRKPVVEDGTLDEDLARRDFTVNALAASLAADRFGEVTDPFDGLADLEARTLRTPLDPAVTFEDDPLRMLRAARFAAQLGFEVDAQAVDAMRRQAPRIDIVSAERITDELVQAARRARPLDGARAPVPGGHPGAHSARGHHAGRRRGGRRAGAQGQLLAHPGSGRQPRALAARRRRGRPGRRLRPVAPVGGAAPRRRQGGHQALGARHRLDVPRPRGRRPARDRARGVPPAAVALGRPARLRPDRRPPPPPPGGAWWTPT